MWKMPDHSVLGTPTLVLSVRMQAGLLSMFLDKEGGYLVPSRASRYLSSFRWAVDRLSPAQPSRWKGGPHHASPSFILCRLLPPLALVAPRHGHRADVP